MPPVNLPPSVTSLEYPEAFATGFITDGRLRLPESPGVWRNHDIRPEWCFDPVPTWFASGRCTVQLVRESKLDQTPRFPIGPLSLETPVASTGDPSCEGNSWECGRKDLLAEGAKRDTSFTFSLPTVTVGSNGLRASSTVNGTPLRTLGTFATGADRGRSARRAPRDRACEQRRTKADSQTRRGGESAHGAYSASEDGQETV